jgi:hypothetical protein
MVSGKQPRYLADLQVVGTVSKMLLCEFSATALGGETTRAFLLFIPKMRRKQRILFGN